MISNELVYQTLGSNNQEHIYRIHPDGSGRTLVGTITGAIDLAISPDKRRIAFAKGAAGHEQIWVINVDGSGQRQVTTSAGQHFSPAWSPDGQKLAFVNDSSPTICPVSGGAETRLTTLQGYRPTWTPDGREVWFDHSITLYSSQTYRVPSDGTPPSRVDLSQFSTNGSVDFSPDGQQIVFYGVPDRLGGSPFGQVGLFTANRDGSNLRFLTSTSQILPHWSPDGKQLMFYDSLSGTVAVNSDGTNRHTLFAEFASDWG